MGAAELILDHDAIMFDLAVGLIASTEAVRRLIVRLGMPADEAERDVAEAIVKKHERAA